jgi:hypothetical protein
LYIYTYWLVTIYSNTKQLGYELHHFQADFCSKFTTKETSKEAAARGRRNVKAGTKKGKGKSTQTQQKTLEKNIETKEEIGNRERQKKGKGKQPTAESTSTPNPSTSNLAASNARLEKSFNLSTLRFMYWGTMSNKYCFLVQQIHSVHNV